MLSLWRRGVNLNVVESIQPIRAITFVVERVHEAYLRKPGRFPSLRRKHWEYRVVQTNQPQKFSMNVLLRKYVEDLGQPGEIVNLCVHKARVLLLTKEAVYASEENVQKYGKASIEEITFSSRYALTTIGMLSKMILNVPMNKEQSWTLQPVHIRSALRMNQVNVPDYAIIMPRFPISGPDMSINNKEFYAHVLINGREKVPLCCRIQHWATNPKERKVKANESDLPTEGELLFPEDEEIKRRLLTAKYTIVSKNDNPGEGTSV